MNKNETKNKFLWTYLTFTFLLICLYGKMSIWRHSPFFVAPDIFEYFFCPDILAGQISKLRPPLYGYLLNLFWFFGEKTVLYGIPVLQMILCISALYALLALMLKLGINKVIAVIASLLIARNVFGYCWSFLPESIIFSLTSYLLVLYHSYCQKTSVGKSFLINAIMLIGVMLKPSYLIVVIALFIVWLFRWIFCQDRKRHVVFSFLTYCLFLVPVACYSWQNLRVNHSFSISSVPFINDISNVYLSHAYEDLPDSGPKAIMKITWDKEGYSARGAIIFYLTECLPENDNPYTGSLGNAPDYFYRTLKIKSPEETIPSQNNSLKYKFSGNELMTFVNQAMKTEKYRNFILKRCRQACFDFQISAISIFIMTLLWFFRGPHEAKLSVVLLANMLWGAWVISIIFKSPYDANRRLYLAVMPIPIIYLSYIGSLFLEYLKKENKAKTLRGLVKCWLPFKSEKTDNSPGFQK